MPDMTETVESLTKEKNALQSMIQDYDERLKKYEELGTPEEVSEALKKAEEVKESVGSLTADDIQELRDKLAKYEEIGTPDEIDEAIDKATSLLRKYKECGSPDEVSEAIEKSYQTISEYKELGTPDEINEVLEKYEDMIIKDKSKSLANSYNVSPEVVESMYRKTENFEVVESLIKDISSKPTGNDNPGDTKEIDEGKTTPDNKRSGETSTKRMISSILRS